jgi:hypothetical protein
MNLSKEGSDLGMSLGKRSDLGMRGLGQEELGFGFEKG